MLRHARAALLATAACLFAAAVTGCAAQADLAKANYGRTTVPAEGAANPPTTNNNPAPGPGSDPGKPVDAAFATDKLRNMDPCGLLDRTWLDNTFGSARENTVSTDLSECSNFMKDKQGADLSITVRVGESIDENDVKKAAQTIGGLKALQFPSKDNDACFIRMITQEQPYPFDVGIQIGYKQSDPCGPAAKVAEFVADKIRKSPPVRPEDPTSIATVNPCTVITPQAVAEALNAQSEKEGYPYGMNKCTWANKSGLKLSIWFTHGYNPKVTTYDPFDPIDLGGQKVWQLKQQRVYPTCKVAWLERPDQPGKDQGQVIEINIENIPKDNVDICAKAQGVAKAVLAKVPKPGS